MNPWAVVPVKSFEEAKSRMSHLSRARRAELARSLFEHVMDVLAHCSEIAGILVLTNGDDVAEAARCLGVDVLRDDGPARLAHIIDAGLAHLSERGMGSALVVMSDLPRLEVRAISRLAADMRDHQIVIAPDLHELGTNALGMTPPTLMPTCFGNHDSFLRHLAAAGQRGLRHAVCRAPELGLDLDLPADLALLDP